MVTEESAEAEPAWQGVGQEVGLKIWRIVVCVTAVHAPTHTHAHVETYRQI